MTQIMFDMGEPLAVNSTEVGSGARHPNLIEDVQLVRFYLNIFRNMGIAPDGGFNAPDREVMTEDADMVQRIFQFQLNAARNLRGSGHYVVADGKVSVPHVEGGALGYGTSGGRGGLYAIRQLATTWGMYKALNRLDDSFRISQHPVCASLLRSKLVPMGM